VVHREYSYSFITSNCFIALDRSC